jgi:hypothetical protein
MANSKLESITDVEKEIERLQQDLKGLNNIKNKILKDIKSNSQSGQLAIFLHKQLCKKDHVEGCDWYYGVTRDGIHDWTSHDHKVYWELATDLSKNGFKCEDVTDIVNIIRSHV